MQRRRLWLGLLIAGGPVAVACGSGGSGSKPPPLGSEDSGVDAGIDASPLGDSSRADSSHPVDSATDTSRPSDGSVVDSGMPDGSADAGPVSPSACDPTAPWSTFAREPSIAAAGFDRFGSVSANELTVAWTTAAGQVMFADRSAPTGAFGAATSLGAVLDGGGPALANDRVALDSTGQELVATTAGGGTFVRFSRTSQATPWVAVGSAEFKDIAATVAESGGGFAQPVLSIDGLSFFYVLTIGTNLPLLYESAWVVSTKSWALGVPLPNPEFAITSASQLRRPTGVASDRRTLFFYDEVAGHERAAWRDTPSGAFNFFADLPSEPEAVPSDTCNTLYFHGSDANGQGLFTAQ